MAESSAPSSSLRKLAKMYGVELSYTDAVGTRQATNVEGVLAALRALGAPVARERDIPAALRQRQREMWTQLIEPAAVAWDGAMPALEVRLPATVSGKLNVELTLEGGETNRWTADVVRMRSTGRTKVDGEQFIARALALKTGRLPHGYHRLSLRLGGAMADCLVISAPTKCYTGPASERKWGVFLPLYALHSEHSWGSGDFSDLGWLADWTADMGGRTVATLPLFASFLDQPFEPSPYSPVSRLFWNEFYLDVSASPDLARSPAPQKIIASPGFRRELGALRRTEIVDYKRGMAIKRKVLEALAEACFEAPGRMRALRKFVRDRPAVEDYARFRAVVEKRRKSWRSWPERLRDGCIGESDYDDEARRYHLYVQFLAHEQLSALHEKAAGRDVRLLFDLPLGADSSSYDVWRERDVFARDLSTGAPPDALFGGGQNWGFPPAHPENTRRQGYRYFRSVIGNMLRYGRILRMDHVMGLHHLYCIPRGMDARHGVYVRFPAEEMYAVLSLESHRHKALIAGEDLGTVPPYVRTAMTRHAVNRTYVVQYEVSPVTRTPLPEPTPRSVAALNTHDMPPFAAYWQGIDTNDRLDLHLLSERRAAEERRQKVRLKGKLVRELRKRKLLGPGEPSTEDVQRAMLVGLGKSPAHVVVANLEDAWGETQPQNVPGTNEERVNWRRKARYSLEEMQTLPQMTRTLQSLHDARRKRKSG